MKTQILILGVTAMLFGCVANATNDTEGNKDAWTILFDGTNLDAWRGHNSQTLPSKWKIVDGLLMFDPAGEKGGDIITKEEYSDFEFELEFKLSKGANSGIKYFVVEELSKGGSGLGLEFQLLDDENHPDAKAGRNGNRTLASLYDLMAAAADKPAKPIGEWNTAKIISKGAHVEHWLNGQKVLEYERGSVAFIDLVAKSKYKDIAGFGLAPAGHLLLQDHGNLVWYRNIRVRPLKPE
jgi:hypothetical protein